METVEELYERSDYEFEQKLFSACRSGDLEFIEEFVNSNIKKDYMFASTIWHMLEHGCKNKQSNIVKYIIETKCLIDLINTEKAFERCFQDACTSGGLEIVKYLWDSNIEELTVFAIGSGCREAIQYKHQDIIKLILNHPKSKDFLKYELSFPELLQAASEFNNVEALKYIASFPNLMKDGKSYLYDHADKIIYFAIHHENIEVVRFLVCDMDFDKTKDIKQILKQRNNKEINNIFKLKKLNKDLTEELISEASVIKRMKL